MLALHSGQGRAPHIGHEVPEQAWLHAVDALLGCWAAMLGHVQGQRDDKAPRELGGALGTQALEEQLEYLARQQSISDRACKGGFGAVVMQLDSLLGVGHPGSALLGVTAFHAARFDVVARHVHADVSELGLHGLESVL